MADKGEELTMELDMGKERPPLKLTEERALTLFHRMQDAFGWRGTIFMRSDAEDRAGKALTDEEWSRVRASWPWKKGLPDVLTERGWDLVDDALREAGVEKEGEDADYAGDVNEYLEQT